MSSTLLAEHGLSYLIERGDERILFDTAQRGRVLEHNAGELDLDLGSLTAVVLSHGHYDHTGGLEQVLQVNEGVEVHAHPEVFVQRVARDSDGSERSIGIPLGRSEVERRASLRLSRKSVQVVPGVFTTGEIRRGVAPEPRDPRLLAVHDGELRNDPLLDDMSLVIETRDGLVVITGCCHSGLENTLAHVSSMIGGAIRAVVGGTHLASADDQMLLETVTAARDRYGVREIHVGHCSGTRGLSAFARVFGDNCGPSQAGLSWLF